MARIPSGTNLLKQANDYLLAATSDEEIIRAKSVLIPLQDRLSLQATADILGVSKFRVCRLRTEFIRSNGIIREKFPRGGRRNENMSPEEEKVFLAPFVEKSKLGTLDIHTIKDTLEKRLGRKVALASAYNLLQRHGWCKTGKNAIGVMCKTTRSFLSNRINIINIDSRLPNLALEKVKKYYLDKGYIVESQPRLVGKIPSYISVIFEHNRHKVTPYEDLTDTYIGGTGYDAKIKLPPEIDAVKPRINIGYTTRGCNRSCPFCLVPEKEGKIHIEGTIYDIWDGTSSKITLLDNNILQLPDYFREVCNDIKNENLVVDFNQGIDIRLLDEDIAEILQTIRMQDVRFALDSPSLIPMFYEKLNLLRRYKIRRDPLVYVLVGFDTTWDEDMKRVEFLKKNGCRPYIQRYKFVLGNSRYAVLSEWCNQFWSLQKMSFEEFEVIRRERPDKKKKRLFTL